MVIGAGAVEMAHSGSLRPWPVTVQTTVEPARDQRPPRPAAAGRPRWPRCPARRRRRPRGPAAGTRPGSPGRSPRAIRPPDASRASSAFVQRPGCRCGWRWRSSTARAPPAPLTIGAAPAAWKPNIRGRAGGVAGREVLDVAHPVRGDVAGVADRQAVDVGRVAERLDDLERGGLLAVQPVEVDRVDQRHRVVLGQLRRRAPGSRRSCRRPAAAWRRAPAPGPACRARSCPAARAPRRSGRPGPRTRRRRR